MDEKTENRLLVILVIILIIAVIALVFSTIEIRKIGLAMGSASAPSRVEIKKFVALSMSPAFAQITFPDVETLPATDLNAQSNNYGSSGTSYDIEVSSDSNVNPYLCTKADEPLQIQPAGATIPIAGYTYASDLSTDPTTPAMANEGSLSITWTVVGPTGAQQIIRGNRIYFRFWLDVPVNQEAGIYENNVLYQSVGDSADCATL